MSFIAFLCDNFKKISQVQWDFLVPRGVCLPLPPNLTYALGAYPKDWFLVLEVGRQPFSCNGIPLHEKVCLV